MKRYSIYRHRLAAARGSGPSYRALVLFSGPSFGGSARWRCRLASSWWPFLISPVTYWNKVCINAANKQLAQAKIIITKEKNIKY